MAKTYSGSAQAEPTTAPPPRRTTRSQSAEPQEQQRQPQSRGGRGKSAEPATASKRGGKTKAKASDLPTVDENEHAVDDNDDAQMEAQLAAQLEQRDVHRPSPRRVSAASGASRLSGTTAKTSFSQEQAELMDSDVIIDILPQFVSLSHNLATHLAPDGAATRPETWKEIRQVGTKHNKIYNTRIATLELQRPSFGSQEFIDPRHVLSALLTQKISSMDDVPAAVWRPDNIIFKINLAHMLNQVLVVCDPADWTDAATHTLGRLMMVFPAAIAGREFTFEALEMWLDLASQAAIRHLDDCIANEPDFDPHEEIEKLFMDDRVFIHAETLGLHKLDEQNHGEAIQMVNDLIVALKAPFKGGKGAGARAATGKLKEQFRWDTFRDHVLRYYEVRSQELDAHIQNAGGAEQIVLRLSEEVERRANERLAEQMKSSYAQPRSTAGRKSFKSGMAALKAREKQIAGENEVSAPAELPVASNGQQDHVDILNYDFGDNEQPDVEIAPSSRKDAQPTALDGFDALDGFQALQGQNQQRAKAKARFTDRQPNAVRISHDMDEYEDENGARLMQRSQSDGGLAPPQSSNKRAHSQIDDQPDRDFTPSQDDGFQEDPREHANASQRRREVSFGKAPARHASVGAGSDAAGPSQFTGRSAAGPSPAKRQRKNPGSAIPPPTQTYEPDDPALPKSQFYKQAKIAARQGRVFSAQEKPTQARRPWTDEEESALIELIEEYGGDGISYASLKAIDQQLEVSGEARLTTRSAEDMRFKARNMRVTMMLAGRQLPPNWDQVALGAKEVTKLTQRGIPCNYQRLRGTRFMDE